jgi:DNA-binding HxlR family transcriptional regulator
VSPKPTAASPTARPGVPPPTAPPRRKMPPLPGRPVRGSSSGRPLMAALDLLGRRWTLRILWELRDGGLGARALRRRCDDMSSSVLYGRLVDLRAAGLIAQAGDEAYELTSVGRELGDAIAPLQQWADRWAAGTARQRGARR